MGEHLPCKQGVKGSNPSISIVAKKAERQQEGGAAAEGRSGDWGEVVTR